jgi:Pyridoxamine 5'-phosphate oxidase
MSTQPSAERLDTRFSDPAASGPTPWAEVAQALEAAELYWLATVRRDGRPHVTPLIGVVDGGVVHFCTGLREQKAHNLEAKYGEAWHFDAGEDAFHGTGGDPAAVFRVEPAKVLAFAKAPHAQTTYRFADAGTV